MRREEGGGRREEVVGDRVNPAQLCNKLSTCSKHWNYVCYSTCALGHESKNVFQLQIKKICCFSTSEHYCTS